MGVVNIESHSGPRLSLRLFLLLLLFSSFSCSTCVHASYIGLDLSGNAVILSDAGKNVSLTGKNIFANGMDLGLLHTQVQQLQQAMAQQHECLLSLQAMVTAQQKNINQQQSIIEHQQETITAQNDSLTSLQSLFASQQQTIALLQLTLTTVTGCTLPTPNSAFSNSSSPLCRSSFNTSCFTSTNPGIEIAPSKLNNTANDLNQNVSIMLTSTIPSTSEHLVGAQKVGHSLVDEFISQLCALGSSFASSISIAMPLQQQISTNGAYDLDYFIIRNTSYLAVANSQNGNSYNIPSIIYRFDQTQPPGSQFVPVQQISTNAARDWEFFTIGNNSYLAVANNYDGNSWNIPSNIYHFDETQPPGSQFMLVQQISTNGALDWECFTIASTSYLAVANDYNGNSWNTLSNIYRFDETQPPGSQFVLVQQISTNGAVDWEYFKIGDTSYLAVANSFNGNSYNIPSNIYRFDQTQPT